jgi:aspartate/methionine/tyrosine aminotransferase
MNRIYRKRRDLAGQIMDTMGCVYNKKQVGLFLWGKIPSQWTSGEQLSDKILYDSNVFITPGFIFGSNGDQYVRLSLCAPEEKLKEALERIKKTLSWTM